MMLISGCSVRSSAASCIPPMPGITISVIKSEIFPPRWQYRMMLSDQHRQCQASNHVIVFDEENSFRLFNDAPGLSHRARRFGILVDARQINRKCGATSGLALNPNRPSALPDDSVDRGQSEAGTFA